jgi:hypothetical protein
MSKIIKCLLLKVDNVLITEIEEIGSDIGEPDCKLINPYQFTLEKKLIPWPELELTNQKEIMIHSDSILTIVDPSKEQLDKYQAITAE